jgi:hypothetical protein
MDWRLFPFQRAYNTDSCSLYLACLGGAFYRGVNAKNHSPNIPKFQIPFLWLRRRMRGRRGVVGASPTGQHDESFEWHADPPACSVITHNDPSVRAWYFVQVCNIKYFFCSRDFSYQGVGPEKERDPLKSPPDGHGADRPPFGIGIYSRI